LRTEQGLDGLRAAAAAHLSAAGQLQVATALDMLAATEAQLGPLRHQLRQAAAHLMGAQVRRLGAHYLRKHSHVMETRWLAFGPRYR
jgi:hypothetical protein